MPQTIKYTIELTKEQSDQLSEIQKTLHASSKAEVIRKSLGLAVLMADVVSHKQRLAIVDADNEVQELIRIL